MIKGHGIDIESIAAIEKAYQKNTRFAEKVLTEAERERFEELSGKRKMEYLTGRWSAKEAFSKAMGTGIGPVGFQDNSSKHSRSASVKTFSANRLFF